MPVRRMPTTGGGNTHAVDPDVERAIELAASKGGVRDRRPKKVAPREPVGFHLSDVIHEKFNVRPSSSCGCKSLAAKMNAGGLKWTFDHYEEIIGHCAGQAGGVGRGAKLVMTLPGGRWIASEVCRGMLDEAITRTRCRWVPKNFDELAV